MPDQFRIRRRSSPFPDKGSELSLGRFSLTRASDGSSLDCGPVTLAVPATIAKAEFCFDQSHTGPPWHNGGPFTSIKAEIPAKRVMGHGHYVGNNQRQAWGQLGIINYDGGFYPDGPYFSTWDNVVKLVNGPSLVPSTTAWEQEAYIRTRPHLQKAGAFVAIAEFSDIPRMLKGTSRFFSDAYKKLGGRESKLMSPKRVADDFLNYNFGWVPFVSDIRQCYNATVNNAKIKHQLVHDNDKWKRKKVLLDDTMVETVIAAGQGMQVYPAGDWISTLFNVGESPYWTVVEKKRSTITAVGSFKYYRPEFDSKLPDFNDAWTEVDRQLTIYGARVSPANVYRAIPWTWLIDWFSDFGSVLDKIGDVGMDGVAAQYLYVMRHDWTERVLTQYLPFIQGGLTLQWSASTTAKVRRPANTPYGFGLSWHLLSPKQLAILAALKITHMR